MAKRLPAPFHTAIGYQNDAYPTPQMLSNANEIGASYVRMIANAGNVNQVRDRMRQARAAGKRVILTVGSDPGNRMYRNPSPRAALKLISQLPRADRYTYVNEPNETGRHAKQYANDWRQVRKVVGKRLLLGDISSGGVPWLANVMTELRHRNDGKPVDVAIHPYHSANPGAIDAIQGARKTLQKASGSKVNWWFTEFGEEPYMGGQLQPDLRRAQEARARAVVLYDVNGPTWNTQITPQMRTWLNAQAQARAAR